MQTPAPIPESLADCMLRNMRGAWHAGERTGYVRGTRRGWIDGFIAGVVAGALLVGCVGGGA